MAKPYPTMRMPTHQPSAIQMSVVSLGTNAEVMNGRKISG